MAVWTDFASLIASLASGKAFTDEKAQALAENIIAAFEGSAGSVADGAILADSALSTAAATAAGTAWVGLRTAGLAAGAVGSYALCYLNVNLIASPGSTHAGSGMRYTNAAGSNPQGTPAGTWRLMGGTASTDNHTSTSLFLRIA